MLSDSVQQFIARHGLMARTDRHIVALSGGADSVCLLLVLHELGYTVDAAHCNFHLRGDEADRDEQFCVSLCDCYGITLHRAHFDTHAYAAAHKVSIEMAARDLRYTYFEQLRRDIGAATICVAHHREDSVETVLLNLIRGTGIDGLTGIAPRHGHVVRPLLGVSRQDILGYLRDHGQGYVTDSTNLKNDVKRNKIRLDVIPLLQTINPSVIDSIYQTSQRLAEVALVANCQTLHAPYEGQRLPIDRLRHEPSAEYMLWHRLRGLGFTPAQVEAMAASLDAQSGMVWRSASHIVVRDRDAFVIAPQPAPQPAPMVVPEPGLYRYGERLKLRVQTGAVEAGFVLSRAATCATLDADPIAWPLTLRRTQQGDRFVPLGMTGSKLVSDYLTDRKKNVLEKRVQLVVADATGRIVWLVGERPDNRCRITDLSRRYLMLSVSEDD